MRSEEDRGAGPPALAIDRLVYIEGGAESALLFASRCTDGMDAGLPGGYGDSAWHFLTRPCLVEKRSHIIYLSIYLLSFYLSMIE